MAETTLYTSIEERDGKRGRVCTKCNEWKPLKQFRVCENWCKQCHKEATKKKTEQFFAQQYTQLNEEREITKQLSFEGHTALSLGAVGICKHCRLIWPRSAYAPVFVNIDGERLHSGCAACQIKAESEFYGIPFDPTYTYLMRGESFGKVLYKVGKSREPDLRAEELKLGFPVSIQVESKTRFNRTGSAHQAEQFLLRYFKDFRIPGKEWLDLPHEEHEVLKQWLSVGVHNAVA